MDMDMSDNNNNNKNNNNHNHNHKDNNNNKINKTLEQILQNILTSHSVTEEKKKAGWYQEDLIKEILTQARFVLSSNEIPYPTYVASLLSTLLIEERILQHGIDAQHFISL